MTVMDLKNFEFFGAFEDDDLARIAECGRHVRYPAALRLFHEGAPATGCWLLESGQVDIDVRQSGTRPVALQSLGAGDLVGWSWLIAPHRWHFGGVTVTQVAAVLFDTKALLSVLEDDPRIGFAFTRRMCETVARRLQASRAQVVDYERQLRRLQRDLNNIPAVLRVQDVS